MFRRRFVKTISYPLKRYNRETNQSRENKQQTLNQMKEDVRIMVKNSNKNKDTLDDICFALMSCLLLNIISTSAILSK